MDLEASAGRNERTTYLIKKCCNDATPKAIREKKIDSCDIFSEINIISSAEKNILQSELFSYVLSLVWIGLIRLPGPQGDHR